MPTPYQLYYWPNIPGRGEFVRLVLENTGWLPTYVSQRALERKAVRPIEVELTLPEGGRVVAGEPKQEAGELEAGSICAAPCGGGPTRARATGRSSNGSSRRPRAGRSGSRPGTSAPARCAARWTSSRRSPGAGGYNPRP